MWSFQRVFHAAVGALVLAAGCGGEATGSDDRHGDASGGAGNASIGGNGAQAGTVAAAAGSIVAGAGGTMGGSAGAGGTMGGSAGAGGMPDSRCPALIPDGDCNAEGLSCLYDQWTGCLCVQPVPADCYAVASNCPSGPISGSTHGPSANFPETCDCMAGSWSCHER